MLLAAAGNEKKWKAVSGKKSAGCEGKGICLVKESSAMNFTFATDDFGTLSIRINKDELASHQPEVYDRLSMQDVYEIEEAVVFPTELAAALELEDDYTIPIGIYAMTDSGEEFVVHITDDGTAGN